MTDGEDVRTRVEDALRRAASTAYEAAHGAIDQTDNFAAPSRWRVFATPRVAVTAVLVVAIVGSLIAFMPRGGSATSSALVSTQAQSQAGSQVSQLPTASVVVHVAGAVGAPGVYTLDAGARVSDALDAAGGALDGADLDAVNLARILSDGEQVRVGLEDEVGFAGEAAASGGLININTADAATLEQLPGVGPVLAGRIVEHRDANGPFASVDALDDVSGVGPAILEQVRAEATV